jgi:hypothetical protein
MQSDLLPDVLLHAETRDRVTAVRPLHNPPMQWTVPASKLFDVPEPARPLNGITLGCTAQVAVLNAAQGL